MAKALETLAVRVKERREYLGYSQRELAQRCAVSAQTISNIENATKGVDFKTIGSLAFVLECEETDLFLVPTKSSADSQTTELKRIHSELSQFLTAVKPKLIQENSPSDIKLDLLTERITSLLSTFDDSQKRKALAALQSIMRTGPTPSAVGEKKAK
jgi:transcriptional regulator with XRE-family HTH domain